MVTNRRLLLMFIRMWETQTDFEKFEEYLRIQKSLQIISVETYYRLLDIYNKQI